MNINLNFNLTFCRKKIKCVFCTDENWLHWKGSSTIFKPWREKCSRACDDGGKKYFDFRVSGGFYCEIMNEWNAVKNIFCMHHKLQKKWNEKRKIMQLKKENFFKYFSWVFHSRKKNQFRFLRLLTCNFWFFKSLLQKKSSRSGSQMNLKTFSFFFCKKDFSMQA